MKLPNIFQEFCKISHSEVLFFCKISYFYVFIVYLCDEIGLPDGLETEISL